VVRWDTSARTSAAEPQTSQSMTDTTPDAAPRSTQPVAVLGERDRVDRALLTAQRHGGLPAGDVPHAGRLVEARRGEPAPVRAESVEKGRSKLGPKTTIRIVQPR